jgi:hypothetical protein
MSPLALRRGRRIPGGALSSYYRKPASTNETIVYGFVQISRAVRNCQWQGPIRTQPRVTLGPCAVFLVQPALYAAQGAGRLSDEPDKLEAQIQSRVCGPGSAFY